MFLFAVFWTFCLAELLNCQILSPVRSLSAQDQQPKPGEEIDQAAAGDDSLHLDLLLRATASASGRTRPDAETWLIETSAVSTRAARLARPRKSASAFVTSPATLRNADEDSTIHPSKFDVGSLYQGHLETLQNDRNCMLVHFANGRILFSNACCDRLFSTLTPLRHREVTEIIAEEDRVNFSSRIMYLSIGKFTVMERSTFNIITAKGVVPANIFGEHLMGSVWWMDCELVFLGVPIPSSKAMSSAIADLSCAVVAQLASYED
eukprot:g5111.t1